MLTKEKPRNQDNFACMTQQAGIVRHHDGLGVVTARVTPWTGLVLYGSEFYLPDGLNTAYGEITYDVRFARDWRIELGFHYTDQRSVGAQLLGDFVTWSAGGQARLSYAGASVLAAFAFTGQVNNIHAPWRRCRATCISSSRTSISPTRTRGGAWATSRGSVRGA